MKTHSIPTATRYAIISGTHSPSLHQLIRQQVADEEWERRLRAVAEPDHIEALIKLADERFQAATTRANESGEPMAVRSDSLRSVYEQVCRGELP